VNLRRRGEQSLRGEASELDSPSGRARATARATLGAAAQSVNNVHFGLEGVALLDLFNRKYTVVSIEAAARRRFMILSGIIAQDAARSFEEAAALATLRAVDRWLTLPPA
jgi:hypothetical protein